MYFLSLLEFQRKKRPSSLWQSFLSSIFEEQNSEIKDDEERDPYSSSKRIRSLFSESDVFSRWLVSSASRIRALRYDWLESSFSHTVPLSCGALRLERKGGISHYGRFDEGDRYVGLQLN